MRIALARALAVEPRVLLLDEPFGALDARVRAELRQWLRRLHDELNVTTVFVTHDQEEALELADRVVVMHRGRIQQAAKPTDLFDEPSNAFVLEFLGDVNLFEGVVQDATVMLGRVSVPARGFGDGARVRGGVRSFALKFWVDADGPGVVERMSALGDRVRVDVRLDHGESMSAQFPRRSSLLKGIETGSRVQVEVTHAHLFAAE